MKLSQWRPRLMYWLQKNILVDSWALDNPDYVGRTMGFLPPLRDVSYTLADYSQIQLEAIQDFFVLKRLTADFTYKDLPVNVLEGIYSTLAIRLIHNYREIDEDVLNLTLEDTDRPLKVSELGEDIGDWLAEMVWSLKVKLQIEPEDGDIQKPFVITGVSVAVYRDGYEDDLTDGISDANKRVLDYILKTP